jgi:hypothetical protein
MRLVAAGERVLFAPEASVSSAMPTSLRQSRTQDQRWESGKLDLIRHWSGRLVLDGLRRRDIVRLHAGIEPLVPSQSVLAVVNLVLGIAAVAARLRAGRLIALASLAGQVCFVVGGLLVARAPANVYRALLLAPVTVAWKTWIYLVLLAGHRPRTWVRTARTPRQARGLSNNHPDMTVSAATEAHARG